jgi:hypothetical protein
LSAPTCSFALPIVDEIEKLSVRSFWKVKTLSHLGTSAAALSLAFILSKSAIWGVGVKDFIELFVMNQRDLVSNRVPFHRPALLDTFGPEEVIDSISILCQ